MEELSRLVPELGVLIVVLGFFYKLLTLAKEVFEDLARNIEHNTAATKKNTKLVQETVEYLKHRNGTFEALIKDAPALHELVKRVHK